MRQITEENRPRCINFKKCGNIALTLINDIWVCGECLIKLQNKLREEQKKMFLSE